MPGERDYPIGHPAASDYKGEPYTPPGVPYFEDFPKDHPARLGKNVAVLDSPDGMRAALLKQSNRFTDLARSGSVPQVKDTKTGLAVPLTADQLAHVYSLKTTAKDAPPSRAEANQIVTYFVQLGYTEAEADEMLTEYFRPPQPAASQP